MRHRHQLQRASGQRRPWRRLFIALGGAVLACLAGSAHGAGFTNQNQLHLLLAAPGKLTYWQLTPKGQAQLRAIPSDAQVPLGSLWKLWVYAYLVDSQDTTLTEQPYTCQGNNPEEAYCCSSKGEAVGRDQALARSCGLYFNPSRLNIDAARWRAYWQQRALPPSLLDLNQLGPEHSVWLMELIKSLAQLPAQHQAQRALLAVMIGNKGAPYAEQLGSRLRVKTWSWRDAQAAPIGGFAGWLPDGSVVWAQAEGTSAQVLKTYAQALNQVLPNPAPAINTSCVQVNLFAAYPISQVLDAAGKSAQPGPLKGQFKVLFAKGTAVTITSHGEISLAAARVDKPELTLSARVSEAEYLARVLEREAAPEPLEAAKALTITARTYLLQNARRATNLSGPEECLQIDDSSQTQRVSPNPARRSSLAIAYWTADLISQGAPVRYHLNQAADNRLSWQAAVQQARQGQSFHQILSAAFPANDLASQYSTTSLCKPLPQARSWLEAQIPKWRTALSAEPGFAPPALPQVCQLQTGNPYNDAAHNRIFARGFYSLQQRLDITHEYLHLAFGEYPTGQDETYIEQLARRLLLGKETP